MSAIELFTYEDAQLRTVLIESEPWFVAADACKMLTLRDTSSAMGMVDEDDKRTIYRSDTPQSFEGIAPQVQALVIVNESGLYALIFQSNKDKARDIRRWVTREVLPAIRRTGSYSATPALTDDELIHRALTVSAARVEALTQRVAELEPQAQVATMLLDADGDLSVRDAAQVLTRAGIQTGERRLFSTLAIKGWIKRAIGDGRYRPLQKAVEAGYISVLPQSHYHARTGVLVLDPPQVRVTPKGLQRLLSDYGNAS